MEKNAPKIDLWDPTVEHNNISKEDQSIIDFVNGRCKEMVIGRRTSDREWPNYQKQLEAIWQPYPDGRSSFAIPMTRALVERGIAEEIKVPITRIIQAERWEFEDKAIAYELVRKFCGRVNGYDWEILKNAYTCWLYGTSILHTHFERTVKSQYEATFSALDDIQYKKKYVIQNGILVEDFNINNFYPDNRVIEWDDAVDCYAEQIIPYDTFLEFANQKIYENIDKVEPTSYYDGSTHDNYSEEERSKQWKYVHIKNYWNESKDFYVAIANNTTKIRCHPVWSTKKWAKCLPFSMRKLWFNPRSLYGVGMGYYGQQLQSNMNDVSEMIFDGVRRSTEETMILGNNIDIEGQKMVYGNRILKANGILNGNIDRMQGTPPNQAVFDAREMLIRDINRFIGLDLENLVATAGTAFQANLIAESQQKQVNVWLKNRDMAMEDVEDKLKDCIQVYFPLDVPYRIVDSMEDIQPEVPSIEIIGKKYNTSTKKFVTTKNKTTKSVIDIDSEMLKWDYYVDVTTNTSEVASAVIRQDQVLKYVQAIWPVIEASMLAKQAGIDDVINVRETLETLAKAYNIPQKETANELEMKNKTEQVKQDLQAVAIKMWVSPNAWQPPVSPNPE